MALSPMPHDPRLYRITAIWNWDSIVELFFIDGPTRALIDTGASYTPRQYVEPALRWLGLELADIDVILNTHGHQDHMGGNHALLNQVDAQVYMHREDAYLVEDLEAHMDFIWHADRHVLGQDLSARRAQFLHTVTGPSAVHRKLDDNEIVDLGDDIQLRVVHLPGHSPGSIAYHWEDKGIAFVGDAVQGYGSKPGTFPLYYTARGYEQSMQRLASLQIETLVLAHRYLWTQDARDALRSGKAAEQTVQDSIAVTQMIHQAVQEALRAHAGAGFLPVALAATQALAAEMPFTIEPRTGLPTGLPATLYSHYTELTGGSKSPVT
ncbi:MAG: MBL fold metallo-hydrolase [Chloroflexota bacterium]|nr:MBL fold metallo-hydrolase [Chloroflexota bacterium]MDE2930994.1 MBL fold metallo-hydrolase [Chloroflexota bacterium]